MGRGRSQTSLVNLKRGISLVILVFSLSFPRISGFGRERKSLVIFKEFFPDLAPGHLFMLGRLAVPKIIYVRPVGSPAKHFKYWGKS